MCGPAQQDLALRRELDLGARRRLADGADLEVARIVGGGEAGVLGLAVDLVHPDAQRPVPADEVGRDRRRAGDAPSGCG